MTGQIYTGEVQLASWSETHNGGCKVVLWLPDPEALEPFKALTLRKGGQAGQIMLAAFVGVDEGAQEAQPAKASETGEHGQFWRDMFAAGFFNNPSLRTALGTDNEFQMWCRARPCAICGAPAPSEYAHTRRIAAGAGTGTKPLYSGLPMCHDCHSKQHQGGESAIGGKEEVDSKTAKHLAAWAKDALKERMGVGSLRSVSPADIERFLIDNGIGSAMPPQFRGLK